MSTNWPKEKVPKIKKYLQSLPVLFFTAAIALIATLFLVNFILYRQSQTAFFSSVRLTVNEADLSNQVSFSFNLAKSDRPIFKKLAQSLGLVWTNDRIDLNTNRSLTGLLGKFNNQLIDLKLTDKELFLSTVLGTEATNSNKLWKFVNGLPEDTAFYLETQKNLAWGLPKELGTFFDDSNGAVALFPVGNGSALAWLQNTSNPKIIGEKITKFTGQKNVSATPEATLEDLVIEKVPLNKFRVGDKAYYLGLLDNTLVVTSSEEGFRTLTKVKNKAKSNLLDNRFFNQGRLGLSPEGSLAFFIGNTSKLNIISSNDQGLRDLFILTGVNRGDLGNYLDKITNLNLVVSGANNLEGMVNFR